MIAVDTFIRVYQIKMSEVIIMRFKLSDPYFGSYYVVAEVVTWMDGILTLNTSRSDFRFLCSRRSWGSIQFWFWFGCCYIDLTKLTPVLFPQVSDVEY